MAPSSSLSLSLSLYFFIYYFLSSILFSTPTSCSLVRPTRFWLLDSFNHFNQSLHSNPHDESRPWYDRWLVHGKLWAIFFLIFLCHRYSMKENSIGLFLTIDRFQFKLTRHVCRDLSTIPPQPFPWTALLNYKAHRISSHSATKVGHHWLTWTVSLQNPIKPSKT